MRQIQHSDNFRMLALLAGTTVLLSIVSERIFGCNGLGYDGTGYGLLAMRFTDFMWGEPMMVSSAIYYRFLPSALCHFILRGIGAELTSANVLFFFQIYQAAVLVGICIIWCALSEHTRLGNRSKRWGSLCFFGNYAVLKYGFYYPFLLGLSAVLLGTTLLHAYLAGRNTLLIVLTCISFFVWPMATRMGGILTLFPSSKATQNPVHPSSLHRVAAAIAVGLLLAPALHTRLYDTIYPIALPLSITFVACYLYFAFSGLFPGMLFAIRSAACGPSLAPQILSLTAVVAGIFRLPHLSPAFASANWMQLVNDYSVSAVALGSNRPGEFAMSLLLYFGPLFSVIIIFHQPFMRRCFDLGPGFALVIILLALQSLNPLTRQIMAGLPFLILPLVLVLDGIEFSDGFIKIFVSISLTFPKVWMLNNYGIDTSLPGENNPAFWSRYTSSTGWWITNDMYLLQGR